MHKNARALLQYFSSMNNNNNHKDKIPRLRASRCWCSGKLVFKTSDFNWITMCSFWVNCVVDIIFLFLSLSLYIYMCVCVCVCVSLRLCACSIKILTKRQQKKLERIYTKILCTVLNKSWKQKHIKQVYRHLPPISQTIQVRQARHAGEVTFFYELLHMDVSVLADQKNLSFINSMRTLDAVWRTYQEWWLIETRESLLSIADSVCGSYCNMYWRKA